MKPSSAKYFLPTPNYTAVREKMGFIYHEPTEEEIQNFFSFWNSAYKIWRDNNPQELSQSRLDNKIKMRKQLNQSNP